MLEKFTPEEIDAIRKELALMDHNPSKMLANIYYRISDIKKRNDWKRKDTFNIEKMRTAIYYIIDETLGNIEVKEAKTKYGPSAGRTISRNTNAIIVDADEYMEMCDEIMGIIEKHFKWEVK